jgi:hypothetical protein
MANAKTVGSELIGAARDSAVSLIDAQRGRAADQITALGDALRRSAEPFDSTGTSLSRYANQAADQICGLADTVRDRPWGELAGDIEGFARRYPTLFMISAVGIGFIAGRFMLSSSDRRHGGGRGTGMPDNRMQHGAMRSDAGMGSRTVPTGARAGYGTPTVGE